MCVLFFVQLVAFFFFSSDAVHWLLVQFGSWDRVAVFSP